MDHVRIKEDVTMVLNSFNAVNRTVPSIKQILKISAAIPMIAISLSIINVIWFFTFYSESLSFGREYYLSEILGGFLYVTIPTFVIGMLLFVMLYNNAILYLSIPEKAREESLLISHIRSVVKRISIGFITLNVFFILFSGVAPILVYATPLSTFLLLFTFGLVVSAEINRLGIGPVMVKLSELVKKI